MLRRLLEKSGESAFLRAVLTHPLGLVLIPALLGAIASIGQAPYLKWPLTLAALILLFFILSLLSLKRQLFTVTLSFFTAYNALTLWWLNFVMEGFGTLPAALSISVVLLFSVYLSLPYALLTLLAFRIAGHHTIAFNLSFLPLTFTLSDFLIGYLLSGFPWTFAGYGFTDSPFAAFAPIFGVRGMNFLIYITAGAVSLTIMRQFIYLPVAGFIVIAGVLTMGIRYTEPSEERIPLTLVQGNIAQSVKWRSDMVGPTLATYWELSEEALHQGRTVIWPESAIPLYIEDALPLLEDLNAVVREHDSCLVSGIQHRFTENGTRRATNSILVLDGSDLKAATQKRYDKRHLVPFGEYVPLEKTLRPLGSIFNFPMSAFAEGPSDQSSLHVGSLTLNPAICYETVFPELMLSLDSPEVNGILMLSNDSWFGPTRGPLEHLNIARLRAMEMQKPLIRVTNSGVTALIDAAGRVSQELKRDVPAVLNVDFTPYTGQTPYARFSFLPLLLLLILNALWGAYSLKHGLNPTQQALLKLLRP